MKFSVTLTYLCLFIITSCSRFTEAEGAGVILKTEPQPIVIHKEVPLHPKNKIILKEVSNVIKLPERKFKFRTPDLVNDLPSKKEIETTPSFIKAIDDSVKESTIIRATQ